MEARNAREAKRPQRRRELDLTLLSPRAPPRQHDEEMTNGISRALVDFVHRHLRTMDHVEILLCVHRAADSCSMAVITANTRLSDARTRAVVHELVSAGLIAATDGVVFKSVSAPEDQPVLAELAEAYNSRPVALVRAIYSRPSAIQSLADAFKLRKGTEESDQ
jgi:hypothetical protein